MPGDSAEFSFYLTHPNWFVAGISGRTWSRA